MIRLFLAQMRYVMPEYQIERIANEHEIYDNFYEMGGPLSDTTSSGGAHVRRNGTSSKVSPSVKSCRLSWCVVITCAQWSLSVSRHGVSTIHPVSIVS